MIDSWAWLGIIVLVGWYIYSKTYWFRDIDKISEKYGEKLAEESEKAKKSYDGWKSEGAKWRMEQSEDQFKKFAKTYDNYQHLTERFKHDEKGKQVRKDWENYLRATKIKFDCDMDYGADLPTDMLKNTHRKDYKATIAMEEIEKRFKKYAAS